MTSLYTSAIALKSPSENFFRNMGIFDKKGVEIVNEMWYALLKDKQTDKMFMNGQTK